jgi:hypothetical protein
MHRFTAKQLDLLETRIKNKKYDRISIILQKSIRQSLNFNKWSSVTIEKYFGK